MKAIASDIYNVIQWDFLPIRQHKLPRIFINSLHSARYTDIGSTGLLLVWNKVSNGNFRTVAYVLLEILLLLIQQLSIFIAKLNFHISQTTCFLDCIFIACECRKRRKLCCTILHGHLRSFWRNMVW